MKQKFIKTNNILKAINSRTRSNSKYQDKKAFKFINYLENYITEKIKNYENEA